MICEEVIHEEGSPCPEVGCVGKLVAAESKNCSCHINPPCSSCVGSGYECCECPVREGWCVMPSAFSTTNTPEADDPTEIYIELRNLFRRSEASSKSFNRQFCAVIAVMLTVCSVSASWAFVGLPKYQRMALIQQEQLAWQR